MLRLIKCAVPAAAAFAVLSPLTATADPSPVASVFCFRITDIERFGTDGNSFALEFEVLNWTDGPAHSLSIATNIGTNAVVGNIPTMVGSGIDRDGRGGPLGGNEIDAKGPGQTVGQGNFDTPAIHSGRGRGDIPGLLNDWEADFNTGVSSQWSANAGDTPIPNVDLVANPGLAPAGVDGIGDSAIDGGPGIGVQGAGNVLDGFTLSVSDWQVGERLSFNWFLLDNAGNPIGTAAGGNSFGFGIASIFRVAPGAAAFPGALFVGNTGSGVGPNLFYDSVNQVPNPALFSAEFGAGITAGFLNPTTNIFNARVNTSPVPLPATAWLMLGGIAALGAASRRRRRASKA